MSTVSSKPVLHKERSSPSTFNLQYPLVFLRSSSSCLCPLPHIPITSILPSIFSTITRFRRQFQHKMWPIQLAFLFLLFAGYSSAPCLFVILLHFSHGRSNWSSLSFLNTTFQNFPGISDLLSEMFRFQHHIQLYPTCSTLLVSSLNLSPICWWKESPYCWKLLLLW